MLNIEIKNPEVIEVLNDYSEYISERFHSGHMNKTLRINCLEHTRDRWLADDYRERIMQRHRAHDGFPESMRCFHGTMPSADHKIVSDDYNSALEYRNKAIEVNQNLMTILSAKRNTLCTTYPPGGWISWHNNANASGYNILFTWSENGNGWFDYWDMEKKERVRVQDVPGWQCKMGYFGSYDEGEEKLCYHAASTDCLRITVAYVFGQADHFWKDVVEDISSE